jgi:hypothetical protein
MERRPPCARGSNSDKEIARCVDPGDTLATYDGGRFILFHDCRTLERVTWPKDRTIVNGAFHQFSCFGQEDWPCPLESLLRVGMRLKGRYR